MKAVYDTCLYIDLLRSSERLSLFTDRAQIRYLSPIVLMELMAGARTPHQRKTVDSLIKPYSKAQRIIHLGANHYYRAGECVARLIKEGPVSKGLSHDLLIALSAVSIGATLFTNNKRDFERIKKLIPVDIQYL